MAQRPVFDHPGTRILATLGPATDTAEKIDALVEAGASAFRLNFSHGDAEEKRAKIAMIRAISQVRGRPGECRERPPGG